MTNGQMAGWVSMLVSTAGFVFGLYLVGVGICGAGCQGASYVAIGAIITSVAWFIVGVTLVQRG
jgi:hypothetical protein